MNITNQEITPAQNIPQDSETNPPVSNRKGFMPLILGVAILLIIVAGGAYYLGSKNTNLTSKPQIQQPATSVTTPTSNPITSTEDFTAGWKTYASTEGKYSIKYLQDWVVEVYKEKYPYNTSYDKGYIIFQTRATTAKEKADDAPGLPVDMGTGSIKIINTNSMRGQQYANISEQDFFNPNNGFWLKGNAGGGGPGTTYSNPEEVLIDGKRAMKQTTHPTTAYEWVGPNQITTNYYVWLGNSANELVTISFTYDNTNKNKDDLIKNFNQMVSTFKITN